jgi:hypothetical protein
MGVWCARMTLSLLEAHETAKGVAVTFVTDNGVELLEGSCDEIARLADVMRQVSALASLNDVERVWIADVPVGDATVKLGLSPRGQARVCIVRS